MLKKIPRFRPSLTGRELNLLLREIFKVRPKNPCDVILKFEEKFAEYIGVAHAIMVPSARMGLYLILRNLKFKPGDEIILPAFTHHAIPSIILNLGLKPIFVDITRQTCNLNPALIEKLISPSTKAIIPTHLYGLPCNMDAILEIARKYGLNIIEDCAQSCGAEYKGRKTGSMGDAAYFSLGITKNITTLGTGVVTTDDDILAERIRNELNTYPVLPKAQILKKIIEVFLIKISTGPIFFSMFLFPTITIFNWLNIDIVDKIFTEKEISPQRFPGEHHRFRPIKIQAEIGLKQLALIDEINQKRIENAYSLIKELGEIEGMTIPKIYSEVKNIFVSFPTLVEDREVLKEKLLMAGIDTSLGFIKDCSNLCIFSKFNTDCHVSKTVAQHILHIPIHPSLSEKEILYISQSIKRIFYN